MPIDRLELHAADLATLRDYYCGRFGLPGTLADGRLAVRVGATRLDFVQAPADWTGRYHFAFTIPASQFVEAKAWLEARTPLLADAGGEDTFHSDDWDADNLYFADPAGNIGELIARHTLASDADAPFGPGNLLAVSEIGLAAPDVPSAVADLTARLGLATYGTVSDTFAPVGDERGLFIVVRSGRVWFPDTGIPAVPLPFVATVRDVHGTARRVEASEAGVVVAAAAG